MKSQETGWLGNMLGWGQRRQMQTCEVLYASAVEMARDPAFFADHGVADNVDGRFDALALVVSLVMRRLNSCGDAGAALSQELLTRCLRIWTCRFARWAPAILASPSG